MGKMAMGAEPEIVPGFARKRSASDGLEYAIDVAEDKDLVYLVENTCIHCSRLMSKSEVKILPPSYIQERDQYVSRGIVKKRMLCLQCYSTIRATAKEKVAFDRYRNASRAQALKTAFSRFLANR